MVRRGFIPAEGCQVECFGSFVVLREPGSNGNTKVIPLERMQTPTVRSFQMH
jgi:hypothetical protein